MKCLKFSWLEIEVNLHIKAIQRICLHGYIICKHFISKFLFEIKQNIYLYNDKIAWKLNL